MKMNVMPSNLRVTDQCYLISSWILILSSDKHSCLVNHSMQSFQCVSLINFDKALLLRLLERTLLPTISKNIYIYITVVVQFYPWFNFYFLLFYIHYHIITLKKEQMEIKIEPRINLNYSITNTNIKDFCLLASIGK